MRNLVLPVAEDDYDIEVMERLVHIGEEHGVTVTFLSDTEYTEISDGALMLSLPSVMISRSTHPIVSFRLLLGEKSVLYLGASFWEGKYRDECMRLVGEADGLILGRHGPVPKDVILYDREYGDFGSQYLVTDADVGKRILKLFRTSYPFDFCASPNMLIYASE